MSGADGERGDKVRMNALRLLVLGTLLALYLAPMIAYTAEVTASPSGTIERGSTLSYRIKVCAESEEEEAADWPVQAASVNITHNDTSWWTSAALTLEGYNCERSVGYGYGYYGYGYDGYGYGYGGTSIETTACTVGAGTGTGTGTGTGAGCSDTCDDPCSGLGDKSSCNEHSGCRWLRDQDCSAYGSEVTCEEDAKCTWNGDDSECITRCLDDDCCATYPDSSSCANDRSCTWNEGACEWDGGGGGNCDWHETSPDCLDDPDCYWEAGSCEARCTTAGCCTSTYASESPCEADPACDWDAGLGLCELDSSYVCSYTVYMGCSYTESCACDHSDTCAWNEGLGCASCEGGDTGTGTGTGAGTGCGYGYGYYGYGYGYYGYGYACSESPCGCEDGWTKCADYTANVTTNGTWPVGGYATDYTVNMDELDDLTGSAGMFTLVDTTAPAVLDDLWAAGVFNETTARIAWDAAPEDDIDRILLYRATYPITSLAGMSALAVLASTATGYNDTTVASGTEYFYASVAEDNAGNVANDTFASGSAFVAYDGSPCNLNASATWNDTVCLHVTCEDLVDGQLLRATLEIDDLPNVTDCLAYGVHTDPGISMYEMGIVGINLTTCGYNSTFANRTISVQSSCVDVDGITNTTTVGVPFVGG